MNITHFYERYWQRHDEADSTDIGLTVASRITLLKKALRTLPRGTPVLDAGCGAGDFTTFLSEEGFAVTGVDVSLNAVHYAQQRNPGVHFHVAAIETGLPFETEHFAMIWSSEVLEHLFDVHAALSELNRVLRPRGLLVLTTPYHGLIKNLIITLKGFDTHYNPYLSHIRFFSRNSLVSCLERAGFMIEQWHGVGRTWHVWKSQFVVCRKINPPGPPPAIVG